MTAFSWSLSGLIDAEAGTIAISLPLAAGAGAGAARAIAAAFVVIPAWLCSNKAKALVKSLLSARGPAACKFLIAKNAACKGAAIVAATPISAIVRPSSINPLTNFL